MCAATALKICLIACHGGPADHFATYAEELHRKGFEVEVYGSGPAWDVFKARLPVGIYPFSIQETVAVDIAKKCIGACAVITDVGHEFSRAVQEAVALHAPSVLRLAYYDNPEDYVPGGYSEVAAKVMQAAQRTLFANAQLAAAPIYSAPSQEIPLDYSQRIGVGYYPLAKAKRLKQERQRERATLREQLFKHHQIKERSQKLLIYVGGNNETYFNQAFPAFFEHLLKATEHADLSQNIILLQQHPSAKIFNQDVHFLQEQLKIHAENQKLPQFVVSECHSDIAQKAADAIFYYQTSLGPQFILADIPTIQIGRDTYEDILIKNKLCPSVTSGEALLIVLKQLEQPPAAPACKETIRKGLGIRSDWNARLVGALATPAVAAY